MSIVEYHSGPQTYAKLMHKSKSDLAHEILSLFDFLESKDRRIKQLLIQTTRLYVMVKVNGRFHRVRRNKDSTDIIQCDTLCGKTIVYSPEKSAARDRIYPGSIDEYCTKCLELEEKT